MAGDNVWPGNIHACEGRTKPLPDAGLQWAGAHHGFVDFLADTGRWSGSAEQLAGVLDLLNALLEETDELSLVDVPVISDDDAIQVFSELPLIRRTALLAQVWEALARTELISVGPTKAEPSPASAVFQAGSTPDRLEELVFFVDQFLAASVPGYDPEQPWETLVAATVASILLASSSEDPPSRGS